MAITLNNANLVINPAKIAQFTADTHRMRCLNMVGLSASNAQHVGGTNYHLTFATWRTLAALANAAVNDASEKQCKAALIQLRLENGNLINAGASATDGQISQILGYADLLKSMPEDELAKMELYLEGVQASFISSQ